MFKRARMDGVSAHAAKCIWLKVLRYGSNENATFVNKCQSHKKRWLTKEQRARKGSHSNHQKHAHCFLSIIFFPHAHTFKLIPFSLSLPLSLVDSFSASQWALLLDVSRYTHSTFHLAVCVCVCFFFIHSICVTRRTWISKCVRIVAADELYTNRTHQREPFIEDFLWLSA